MFNTNGRPSSCSLSTTNPIVYTPFCFDIDLFHPLRCVLYKSLQFFPTKVSEYIWLHKNYILHYLILRVCEGFGGIILRGIYTAVIARIFIKKALKIVKIQIASCFIAERCVSASNTKKSHVTIMCMFI